MGTLAPIENLKQLIRQVEPDFTSLARIHGAVTYEAEASFALQILSDNSFLAQVAGGAPDTLKRAIINVAAIGLTLNPVRPLAYLVPRKGRICLDISYRGLTQLAQDAGGIKWAGAELVCEKDKYESRGVGHEPVHIREPFGDRGKIIGAYCLAKTHGGEFIVTEMPIDEIYGIRDRSESWKSGKSSPWKTDESEMIKKTVIRRASKSWPLVDTSRFNKGLESASEADPVDLAAAAPAPDANDVAKRIESIRAHLVRLGKSEADYAVFLSRQYKREVKGIESLTAIELEQAEAFLAGIAKPKTEGTREKAS